MSQITRAQLIEAVGQMSVIELCNLIAELEDRWDVRATPEFGHGVDDTAYFEMLPYEPTEWDAVLTSFGANKIAVIKEVRSILCLGLKEAKALVEQAPSVVMQGIDKEDAEQIVSRLVEAGAEAEVR